MLFANIGFDTAENKPFKGCYKGLTGCNYSAWVTSLQPRCPSRRTPTLSLPRKAVSPFDGMSLNQIDHNRSSDELLYFFALNSHKQLNEEASP